MTFIELAARRHSVRKYASTPVEDEKLAEILEAARLAPTAANLQPCRIIAVTGEDARKKLSLAAETYGVPAVLIVCADKNRAWMRPFDGTSTRILWSETAGSWSEKDGRTLCMTLSETRTPSGTARSRVSGFSESVDFWKCEKKLLGHKEKTSWQ